MDECMNARMNEEMNERPTLAAITAPSFSVKWQRWQYTVPPSTSTRASAPVGPPAVLALKRAPSTLSTLPSATWNTGPSKPVKVTSRRSASPWERTKGTPPAGGAVAEGTKATLLAAQGPTRNGASPETWMVTGGEGGKATLGLLSAKRRLFLASFFSALVKVLLGP